MRSFNKIADFLEDPRFRQLMTTPDAEVTQFWRKWIADNPAEKETFELAIATFRAIENNPLTITEEHVTLQVEKIINNLPDRRRRTLLPNFFRIGWAAVLLIVLSAGVFYLKRSNQWSKAQDTASVVQQETLAKIIQPVTIRNTGITPLLLNLPDSSSVLLSVNSSLEYINDKALFTREVRLTGEGFFEIVKNPAKPFLVHAGTFTTRVLGTSFLVRAFEGEKNAVVKVRTGKVEVTSHENIKTSDEAPKMGNSAPSSLVLKASQQATFSQMTANFKIIPRSVKVNLEEASLFNTRDYVLRFKPVAEVFEMLEKTYGVKILYNPETFKNCTITADLTDVSFLGKLQLICMSTDASFEVSDDRVTIVAPGCH